MLSRFGFPFFSGRRKVIALDFCRGLKATEHWGRVTKSSIYKGRLGK